MDFGKVIGAAVKPLLLAVVLAIILNLMSTALLLLIYGGYITGSLAGILVMLGVAIILGLGGFLLTILILGYAGFSAAKEKGADIIEGALVGGIAGFALSIVNAIAAFIKLVLGLGAVSSAFGSDDIANSLGIGAVLDLQGIAIFILSTIFAVGFWTVVGCVLGAVGAAIGGKTEEKKK